MASRARGRVLGARDDHRPQIAEIVPQLLGVEVLVQPEQRLAPLCRISAMLQQITGRRGRIVAMPAGMTLAAGRVGDLLQRLMPGRLPFSHEGIWISALQPHCDDSRTASELGITSRGLRVTLVDTVRWLADQGHLPVARRPVT